ncbi:hypothetical protein OIV83_001521 [Microbotryomycetes sp. JL201]|nr:hypothetical protein OIV83_001521 [Microbotryomycetes sp. JL201]
MDALQEGYLDKLVLAIYLNPDQPNDIVEAYTFTFKYNVDADGQRRAEMDIKDRLGNLFLTSFASASRPAHATHVNAFRRQIQQLIRRRVSVEPGNLRLFYNEATPEGYQPPHFHHVDPDQVRYFASTMHLEDEPDCAVIGHAGSVYHTVSVHTFSVAGQLGPSAASETLPKDQSTKHNVEAAACRKVIWDAEKMVMAVTDDLDKIQKPEAVAVRTQTGGFRKIDEVTADPHLHLLRMQVGLDKGVCQVIHPQGKREAAIFAPAQSDNEILERVLKDIDPKLNSQEPTQIQPAKPRKFPLENPAHVRPLAEHESLKQQSIPNHSKQTLSKADLATGSSPFSVKPGDPDEDGCMIECSNIFVCYGCRFKLSSIDALLDVEKQNLTEAVLQDLQGLALYRRALAIILEHKEVTVAQFKSWLSADAATAKMLIQRLKTDGFVQDWQESAVKKGKRPLKVKTAAKQVKHGTFVSQLSDAQRKTVMKKFFRPDGGHEGEIIAVLGIPNEAGNILESDPIESDDDIDPPRRKAGPAQVQLDNATARSNRATARLTLQGPQQRQREEPMDQDGNHHLGASLPSPRFGSNDHRVDHHSAPMRGPRHSGLDMPSLPQKRHAVADDEMSEPDTIDGVESINIVTAKEATRYKKRKVSEAERIEA